MVKHSTLPGIVGIVCLVSTFITTGAVAQWDNSPGQPGVTSTGYVRAAYGNSDYLYLGGNFTEINGVQANRIVRFDGSAWETIGDGFASDAILMFEYDYGDGPVLHASVLFSGLFRWNGEEWENAGITGGGAVSSWTVYDNGTGPTLYVGGNFTFIGSRSVNRIARWNTETDRWDPIGSGVNGPVSAMAVWDDGSGEALYLGGNFTTSGGVSTPYVSRLRGDVFEDVGGGMATGASGLNIPAIKSLVVWDDGSGEKLYAGGQFGEAGGVEARFMAAWDGNAWAPVGGGFSAPVEDLVISGGQKGDFLYAGGQFVSVMPSFTVNRIARWDGEQWQRLFRADSQAFGTGGFVNAMADWTTADDRVLVVGGQFFNVSELPANRVAFFREQAVGTGGTVSVVEQGTGIPKLFELHQNYPNPFNPSTNIRFELPEMVPVKLRVYTITGQLVAVLVNETLSAGHHTVTFDASSQTSGMYIYRLQAGEYSSTGKMMLLK
ncbi:MAG: T9SS type A sorting domain-containing protein [Cyclonatronaceae bacterium]